MQIRLASLVFIVAFVCWRPVFAQQNLPFVPPTFDGTQAAAPQGDTRIFWGPKGATQIPVQNASHPSTFPLQHVPPPAPAIGPSGIPVNVPPGSVPPLPAIPPGQIPPPGASPSDVATPGDVTTPGTGAAPGETLLIEDEPSWYDVDFWITESGWEGSVEVGINGSSGNTESLSIQSGFDAQLKEGDYTWTADLMYVKTTTDVAETQHNALFNYGLKRGFGDSPWSLFAKTLVEYDEFKAWNVRVALNGGVGYRFWHSDLTELTGRFGAGSSREFGGPNNSWSPEAVFGLDYKLQVSKRQKLKFTTDFYPEWDNFADYRVVSNFAWEFLLDEANNLSLKLDVTDRYDSTPAGLNPNDVNYSLLLLWKT